MRTLILILAMALAGVAQAKDFPQTLPAEFYTQTAKRGPSNLGFVWTAPGFDRSQGITWDGTVTWLADERSPSFNESLKTGLKDVLKPNGAYRMSVTVVLAEPHFFFTGTYRVEFVVRDTDGAIVALAHEQGFTARKTQEGQQEAADKVISCLDQDLIRHPPTAR